MGAAARCNCIVVFPLVQKSGLYFNQDLFVKRIVS